MIKSILKLEIHPSFDIQKFEFRYVLLFIFPFPKFSRCSEKIVTKGISLLTEVCKNIYRRSACSPAGAGKEHRTAVWILFCSKYVSTQMSSHVVVFRYFFNRVVFFLEISKNPCSKFVCTGMEISSVATKDGLPALVKTSQLQESIITLTRQERC